MKIAAVGTGAEALAAEALSLETSGAPPASFDRIFLVNQWAALPDPLAALRQAAALLREDGRLILVEWHAHSDCPDAPEARVALHEMVWLLEHNAWDIHRHGDLGPHCYFLEAGVSDESVQS